MHRIDVRLCRFIVAVWYQWSVLVRIWRDYSDLTVRDDFRSAQDPSTRSEDLSAGHPSQIWEKDPHRVLRVCSDDEHHRDCHVNAR